MVAEMLRERIGSGQLQDGAMLPRQEDVRLRPAAALRTAWRRSTTWQGALTLKQALDL
jgi:hypothetical protein